jgi:hypothetical protein
MRIERSVETALAEELKQQGFEGPKQIPRENPTQKFTDYISRLQKAVNDALNGDDRALQKLEAIFGFTSEDDTKSHNG